MDANRSYSKPQANILAKAEDVQTDRIFVKREPGAGGFAFDADVAHVFDDMVSRSIPLYADVQRLIPQLAALLNHRTIRVVDLGCSTGTSLIQLARSLGNRELELWGIDNSPPMLDRCRQKLTALGLEERVRLACGDIESFDFEDASIVLMNYTLQFIDVRQRGHLLSRIRGRIRDGGFLILSEKLSHGQPDLDDLLIRLYFDYKRNQGYSELEIARKRDALENVLVPLTLDENRNLLQAAGFQRTELMLKWFNFATWAAFV